MQEMISHISTKHLMQARSGMFVKENPLTEWIYTEALYSNVTVKTVWIYLSIHIDNELKQRRIIANQ